MNVKALAAEFVGTFMLVTSIIFVALFSYGNAGNVGVCLSVGFTVMALAYALGPISGGHFNPAVTLGLVAGGRFDSSKVVSYIVAQCLGGIAAAGMTALVARGGPPALKLGNFASNGFDTAGTYSLLQPDLSSQLLANKVTALESGSPDIIATANIGCMAHIESGLNASSKTPIMHWIELLDRRLT